MSDNGPQFACEKFTNFVNEWGFEHRLGSPGHQQTNGKAEAAVKDAKCLLQRPKNLKETYTLKYWHSKTPPLRQWEPVLPKQDKLNTTIGELETFA